MKRIYLDTNFILDYFVRPEFSEDSERLMLYGDKHKLKFFISYLSVANFAYIMRKLPAQELYSIISRICNVFTVVNNTRDQILKNLKHPFKDFEDGLQYQAALESNCDCIISRNKNDFSESKIPVMSATEFLNRAGF